MFITSGTTELVPVQQSHRCSCLWKRLSFLPSRPGLASGHLRNWALRHTVSPAADIVPLASTILLEGLGCALSASR